MSLAKHIFSLVVLCASAAFTHASTVRQAEGNSAVVVEGVSSDAESKVGQALPEGAVVTTGGDGRIIIEVAPRVLIELQPGAQVTIGATDPAGGVDAEGNPIPRLSLNLISGGMVLHAAEASLDSASVVIVTPRGNFSPATPGITFLNAVEPTTPSGSVTVASVAGSGIVTTTEGQPLALGDGLMVVIAASSTDLGATTISGAPQASQITDVSQSSATRISNLPVAPVGTVDTTSAAPAPTPRSLPVPAPAPIVTTTSAAMPTPIPASTPRSTPAPTATPLSDAVSTATPSPTATPTSEAMPTPIPAPTPRSTPAPTATPRPTPSPTATPRPTPSPTATPRPTPSPTATPRPTPSPTATPRPTPTPTPTPRPTPTPTPRPTPVSP